MKVRLRSLALAVFCASLALPTISAEKSTVEPESKKIVWDLKDLYTSEAEWKKAYADIQKRIESLSQLKGQVTKVPSKLVDVLEAISAVRKDFYRLYVYASLRNDENQKIAESQERLAKVRALSTEFEEAVSWLNPEILSLGEKTINEQLKKEKRLEPFAFYLSDLVRSEPHLLDEKGEALLASAGAITSSPNEIYELLVNANVPWPEVKLSDNKSVLLNQAGYSRTRSLANRDDRKKVFDQFWGTWGSYKDSLGAILGTEVQSNIFQSKARNYDSVLQQQLSEENLPEGVYRTLIKEVNNNLSTLHRYFKLRGKILDIDQMHYYDIYPPLIEMNTDFSVNASREMALEVLKPLGDEYYEHLKVALNSQWAHVYPQPGKRSGAYMNGSAYDVHPYVLLNHNDDYNSLSTYLHEWGHAVHSMLANEAQPFETADYSTFTAEIASIINEILLEEHLIANAKNQDEKLFYLGQALESIRGTFYRQAMFAEFELAIHETAERGEPLTGSILSDMYGDLLKKYHDHKGGTVLIDDAYMMEWAYIPHFYYDFYVFQYATSMSGAAWFAERLLQGDEDTRQAFIEVLKAGGSNYAYEILKSAGLDMTTPDPYRATVRRMEDIMDRIEKLLSEKNS